MSRIKQQETEKRQRIDELIMETLEVSSSRLISFVIRDGY